MNTEQVKQITDHALEQLITALEQGKSATLTRYLAAMARFHRYNRPDLYPMDGPPLQRNFVAECEGR